MADGTEPIPEPPGYPLVGNIGDIDPENPVQSFVHLSDKYGPIYRLHFPGGRTAVALASRELINEACDETRFEKNIGGVLGAQNEEPNWALAHRVLMPAFGPMSIKGMFDEMHDIATQLAMKWARHGPATPIMVTDDFTRLTLDTLALCAMGYRFNSYYHDEMHPFIQAMGEFLHESGSRSRRPPFMSVFYRSVDQKYWDDIALLRKTADEVLQARKETPTDRRDLLTAMLEGKDPKTGQTMSDASITDNLITFLIAGHETTSGLLSFAFHHLLKHPDAYLKAQREVDEVVGTGPIRVEHLAKLPYINAVLRETLRVTSTIPVFGVTAKKDEIIGGKYKVFKGENLAMLLAKSHVDPAVFGPDANEFKPERMLDENFERLNKEFPNCWKPFGNGVRACIGRPFAWQEALLVMAMLLQNFNFRAHDTSYQLAIKETLTWKPKDFYMRATLRDGLTATTLEQRLSGSSPATANSSKSNGSQARAPAKPAKGGKPLSVYYGSNSGTCEALAHRLAADASAHGFAAKVVDPLDAANQNLPKDHPVVIITASYEGQPPDNAGIFVKWIEGLSGKELENVTYAVFGCGHHDWNQTYHRIPKLVDSTLEKLGAGRVASIGLTDAAQGDMFTDFETWEDEVLWPALEDKYGISSSADDGAVPGLDVQVSAPRSSTLRQDVKEAFVVATETLTSPGTPPKKHMEIQLPSDLTYTSGDYLAILPLNPKENIQRAMRLFHLPWDAHITISAEGRTSLPTNVSIAAVDVLGAYVELAQPATKRGILALAEATKDESIKKTLQGLAGDEYASEISAKRVSLLDLLDRFKDINLPLGNFLSLVPPMRVRQYSISSSPLWNPGHVTLTYSLLSAPSLSGQGTYIGVASNYLASLAEGDKLHVAVRPSHAAFHLPADAERTPVICIAAGSGLAPFRGFVQERAAMLGAGRRLAPALLFYGCRDPEADDLYRDEFDRWERMGAVDVRRAYSRRTGAEEGRGCRHVQDRLWEDRAEVMELWDRGAKIFVCGSRGVGEGVKKAALKIRREMVERDGGEAVSDKEIASWFESMRNERYATDVFD
ncbi:uncharacterized protein E0L32_000486 [Thyridium curvatum]|uniref:Bifunctional cytochrome P450/NADPH--P450 reductase n=1 Tax=Thyridium curvatum TaxID=1093900 RepID=A0A507AVV3_9PEZI|nr:uncharacterized protein E0L32_000486 [Thyridium curvatum]TPX14092.1 hypothetical protein E0L32_000486 [Thyridium curvatum]